MSQPRPLAAPTAPRVPPVAVGPLPRDIQNGMRRIQRGHHGSQASSKEYENLLQQLASANSNLSKTVSLCNNLRTENETLKKNYEKIKVELVRIKETNDKLKTQVSEEIDIKIQLEEKHEQVLKQWHEKLIQKNKDLDSVKQQLSQELGRGDRILPLEQENLQKEQSGKIEKLLSENKKQRVEYMQLKRESELDKADMIRKVELLESQVAYLKQTHQSELKLIRETLIKTEIESLQIAHASQVKHFLKEKEVLEEEKEILQKEMKEIYNQLQAARSREEEAVNSSLQRKLMEMQAENAKLVADLKSSERNHRNVSGDLLALRTEKENSIRKAVELSDEVERLRKVVQTHEKSVSESRVSTHEKLDERKNEWENEKKSLTSKLNYSNSRITELERSLNEQQEQYVIKLKMEQDARRVDQEKHESAVRVLECEGADLHKEISSLRKSIHQKMASHEAMTQRLRKELETSGVEKRRLEREKEALHEKVKQLQEQFSNMKTEFSTQKIKASDQEKELGTSKAMLIDAQTKLKMCEAELEQTRQKNLLLEDELKRVKSDYDSQKQSLNAAITSLQNEISVRHEEWEKHHSTVNAELNQVKIESETQLKEVMEKLTKYKTKLYALYKKNMKAKELLAQSNHVNNSLRQNRLSLDIQDFTRKIEKLHGDASIGNLSIGSPSGLSSPSRSVMGMSRISFSQTPDRTSTPPDENLSDNE